MFRKEKLSYNCFLTLELDNLLFMDFKLIPTDDISQQLTKYDKEFFKMVGQSSNAHKPLEMHLSKLLNKDSLIEKGQDLPKSYCMKIKDLLQEKMISFIVIIDETSLNQLEFKVNIRKSIFQLFLGNNQDLINYLNKEVLRKIFPS